MNNITTTGTNTTYTWTTNPFMIGWDNFFPKMETLSKTNSTSFPPYNVRKLTDDKFVIELAVAGYKKSDLNISQEDCNVTVTGELPEIKDEYIHKGIAGRKFTRTFCLAEHMEVTGVDLVDGMLYIGVIRNVPEEKKPKTFEINDYKNEKKEVESNKWHKKDYNQKHFESYGK